MLLFYVDIFLLNHVMANHVVRIHLRQMYVIDHAYKSKCTSINTFKREIFTNDYMYPSMQTIYRSAMNKFSTIHNLRTSERLSFKFLSYELIFQ